MNSHYPDTTYSLLFISQTPHTHTVCCSTHKLPLHIQLVVRLTNSPYTYSLLFVSQTPHTHTVCCSSLKLPYTYSLLFISQTLSIHTIKIHTILRNPSRHCIIVQHTHVVALDDYTVNFTQFCDLVPTSHRNSLVANDEYTRWLKDEFCSQQTQLINTSRVLIIMLIRTNMSGPSEKQQIVMLTWKSSPQAVATQKTGRIRTQLPLFGILYVWVNYKTRIRVVTQ